MTEVIKNGSNMDHIVGRELDYKKITVSHGTYQHSKVIAQGGQSVTITTTGGQESIFEISPKVFNLDKSILAYTKHVPNYYNGAARYNYAFMEGLPEVQQIQLYTRSGLMLCDLSSVNKYLKAILRHETSYDQLISYDIVENAATLATTTTVFEGLTRSNVAAATSQRWGAASTSKVPYTEARYHLEGGAGTNAAYPGVGGGTQFIRVKVNLGILKNTIFALDKDLYFGGETLYLRIVWAPSTQINFFDTATALGGAPGATVQDVFLTNLTLYLAVEQNTVIANELMNKVRGEGFSFLLPYVYPYRWAGGTGNSVDSVTLKYNRAHGSHLKKIYWVPYNNTETGITAYDHNNTDGGKIIDFYTTLNNVRLQQFNVDTRDEYRDDYLLKKEKIKGSAIQSVNEYYYNWLWCEDFTDNFTLLDKKEKTNIIDGIDLSTEQIFNVICNTGNLVVLHYFFGVTQKMCRVGANGIEIM